MPKKLIVKRINRAPKVRNRIKRNLCTSLILHERIVTTKARALALLPFANRFMHTAMFKHQFPKRYSNKVLYTRKATDHLMSHLKTRFFFNRGAYVSMNPTGERRKGDAAHTYNVDISGKFNFNK